MEQQDGFNTFHLKICLYRKGDGAFGSVYGEVEDENGGVWKFYGNASFEWEGSWEISELEDIEFESPDGQTGSIPRP